MFTSTHNVWKLIYLNSLSKLLVFENNLASLLLSKVKTFIDYLIHIIAKKFT